MAHGNKDSSKAEILIIDDVELNREILKEIISDMGESPFLAESGEQALEMLESWKPQLILTDISMPGMDGYELCKILKKGEKTRNIPVIFISAFSEPEDIIEGFSLGGEDYITKPFIPEVVQARVGVHLRLYEAKRELMESNRKLQVSVNEQLRQIELEKKNILYAMANIAAQDMDYEKEHMKRLGRNCGILAQGMQLSPMFENKISDTYIDTIELAAPLCNIGNIGIPKEILSKKTELTEDEEAVMRNHTSIGGKLLRDLNINSDYNDFIATSMDVALYHHENWDGSGYPNGRAGAEIPLAAQIVAVAGRYCELTGKEGYSRQEALAVMEKEAGQKFNPDIYKICNKISRQLC
ncbi:MAG: response regulator [Lachnospiraceae bacterium]|nr:response regulator [Lachnospiraceae bacterium]MDE7333460.1 response regulator [Lachnospiraceae bacterium]